jgi:hypothetical protein
MTEAQRTELARHPDGYILYKLQQGADASGSQPLERPTPKKAKWRLGQSQRAALAGSRDARPQKNEPEVFQWTIETMQAWKNESMPRSPSPSTVSRRSPDRWSGSWVQYRLIEAYSVERRLPQLRQRAAAGAWPATVVEWEDLIGRADSARQQVLQSWEYSNAGVSAAELSRMEEAHNWLRIILAPYPTERLCLAHWATAILSQKPPAVETAPWSRSTFAMIWLPQVPRHCIAPAPRSAGGVSVRKNTIS